jgi:hypothetical protein
VDELIPLLERERTILEVLVFRMDTLHHCLASGRQQFVTFASAEVDHAAAMLRDAERERDEAVRRLATQQNMAADDVSLRALAEGDHPSAPTFGKLRDAFLSLTTELETLSRTARSRAERSADDVVRLLDTLVSKSDGGGMTYGPEGDRRRPRALATRYNGAW